MTATRTLAGKVALVAGATRGTGRAIAVALGRAGATVYVTGRSSRDAGRSEMDRPETIEETAELVDAAGGTGVPVRVDHLRQEEVRDLVARIDDEQGRLDVLVNDVWGGDPFSQWGKKLWETDLDRGLHLLRLAVDTHITTSHEALPLLVREPGGVVMEITDGTEEFNAEYRQEFFYDIAKTTVSRMAFGLHAELKPHGATAFALTPGFLRSEAMLEHFGVTEENWRDAIAQNAHFGMSETPAYVARCAAALAADPDVARFGGTTVASWEMAKVYDVDDVDGSRPDFMAYFQAVQKGADEHDYAPYR